MLKTGTEAGTKSPTRKKPKKATNLATANNASSKWQLQTTGRIRMVSCYNESVIGKRLSWRLSKRDMSCNIVCKTDGRKSCIISFDLDNFLFKINTSVLLSVRSKIVLFWSNSAHKRKANAIVTSSKKMISLRTSILRQTAGQAKKQQREPRIAAQPNYEPPA